MDVFDYTFNSPGSRENYAYLDVYTSPAPSRTSCVFGRVPRIADRLHIKWGSPDSTDLNFNELVTESGSISRAYEALYVLICKYKTISVCGNFTIPDLSKLFYWIGKDIPPLTILTNTIEQAVYFTFCHKFYNGNSFTYCNSCDVKIVTSHDLSVYHTMFTKEAHYDGHAKSYLIQEDIAKYGHSLVRKFVTAAIRRVTKSNSPVLHQICAPIGVDKAVYTKTLSNFVLLDLHLLVHNFESHPDVSQIISKILRNIDEYKPRLSGSPAFVDHIISTTKYRALEMFRSDNYVVLSCMLGRHVRRIMEDYNVCVDRVINVPCFNVFMKDSVQNCYKNQVINSWRIVDFYSITEQLEDLSEAMKVVEPNLIYNNDDNGIADSLATFVEVITLANFTNMYMIVAVIIVFIMMFIWLWYSKKIDNNVLISAHRV